MAHWTPLLRRLHAIAKKHHLPNALGRAIYRVNRHYNDGCSSYDFEEEENEVAAMRTIKPATAKRWLLHWSNGGSFKCLKRTVEQERFVAQTKRHQPKEKGHI